MLRAVRPPGADLDQWDVKMTYAGIKDPTTRANVVAYLETLH